MNRIKDFFYNKNDVIVALIILAAAAFIIYTRIDAIMAYPETLADAAVTDQAAAESVPAASEASFTVTIPENPDAAAVSKMLESAGIISSAKEFQKELKKYKMTGSLQPGTVQIPAGASNEQIIQLITGQELPQTSEPSDNGTSHTSE